MKKTILILLLLTVILSCQTKTQEAYRILVPEIGFDSIKVGKTTLKDAVRYYGSYFKTDTFYSTPVGIDSIKEVYSIRVSYDSLGIQLFFRPGNENIFAVSLVSPFKGKTDKGIILNESTFNDIVKIYGDTSWLFTSNRIMKSSPGITFYQQFYDSLPIENSDLQKYLNNRVTEITIEASENE